LPGEYAGLATSQGYTGDSVIYAVDNTTNPDGTVVVSNPQTFSCIDPIALVCLQNVPTPQFATITIFIQGEQTFTPNLAQIGPDNEPFGEYVTGPNDTGAPNLIHCGKEWTTVGGTGGQVCTGTYEVGSKVTLTENLPSGSSYFGGWSTGSGCVDPATGTALTAAQMATSTTCTVAVTGNFTNPDPTKWTFLNGNASVGVIFY
jgi:hypothetical protein